MPDTPRTPDTSAAQWYRNAVTEHGRCVCPTDLCLEERECALCAHLDPEWPCPHDPEVGDMYTGPLIVGGQHD